MRTRLRSKFTLLFMMLGMLLAVPAVALAADLLTEAELSSDVNARTEVAPNATENFNIKVWARGNINNNPNNPPTGKADVINAYTMATNGSISPGTSKTTLQFNIGHNYGSDGQTCPASVATQPAGVTGQGCASDPFIVPATLVVGNANEGTNGTLAVSLTGSNALALTSTTPCNTSSTVNDPNSTPDTTDCSRDQGFVEVVDPNQAPTVGTLADDASGNEGDTLSADGVFSDADGDTLTITKDSGVGTVTQGANGAWSWSHTPNDNGSGTVVVKADDGNGGTVTDSFTWTATNVAPTATKAFDASTNEGSPFSLALNSPSDPSSADTSAGFKYAFDCGDGGGYSTFGTTSSTSCATTDNGTRNVGAKIQDKNGDVTEYTGTVTVNNVAPTATKNFDTSVDEGSSFNLALTNPQDVSSTDTTAGFEYRFDCGSGFGAWGAASSTSCATTDNGTRNVKAEIRDKDLTPVSTYTGTVTVNNVPPTATFEYPSGTVDEGSSFSLALTNPSDPSSADTTAGFTYAFDCGDGSGFVADPNNDGVFSCSTNDNGSRTVKGKITDKDNGSTTYPTSGTVSVTVNNVDPTGTLGNNGPKAEGSAATVSFSNPSDASSVDAASLHYAFDCQGGSLSSVTYASASTTNSKSCTFNDNGSYNVTGVIIDKDGGRHSASTTVTVTNADPVVGALSVTSSTNGVACLGGNTVTLENFSFTDAGSADTHKAVIAWGDGNTQTVDPAVSPEEDLQHTYNSGLGPFTITVTVTDDDGASGSANSGTNNPVSFHYNIGTTLLSPVNADSSSIFKLGSTIPLKVNITDCNGVGVSGLSPDIRMIKTSSSAPLMGVDEGISTQPNDANWVMRDSGNGQYIYNLASKSLPDSTATYKAVITHNGYSVMSTNYFGLKTK